MRLIASLAEKALISSSEALGLAIEQLHAIKLGYNSKAFDFVRNVWTRFQEGLELMVIRALEGDVVTENFETLQVENILRQLYVYWYSLSSEEQNMALDRADALCFSRERQAHQVL